QRGTDGLAGRRVALVGEAAAETAAIDADADATAAAATFDRAREGHFTRARIDDAQIDGQVGLAALAADGDAAEADTTAGACGVLLIGRDRAHDQVLRTGQLTGGRTRAGADATGSGKILFGQHGAELFALDDAKVAGRRQFVRQHAAQFTADATAPPAGTGVVLEFGHGDDGAAIAALRQGRGGGAQAGKGEDAGNQQLVHVQSLPNVE